MTQVENTGTSTENVVQMSCSGTTGTFKQLGPFPLETDVVFSEPL